MSVRDVGGSRGTDPVDGGPPSPVTKTSDDREVTDVTTDRARSRVLYKQDIYLRCV